MIWNKTELFDKKNRPKMAKSSVKTHPDLLKQTQVWSIT